MENRRKQERGITLIALVITIIVMLILVGVTVTTVMNSGLFEHAGEATNKWANAQGEEENIAAGKVTIGDKEYSSWDEYFKEIGVNGGEENKTLHSWTRSGDTISCTHCSKSFTIGQEINYEPDALDESTKVTISADRHGYDSNAQEFTQEQNKKWYVIGVEDKDKDGTNEGLLIKMEPTTTKLTLDGAAGYNNGPEIMNEICKTLYSSTEYGEARSINIEDVNNCFEYQPAGGFYYYGSKYIELTNFTTKVKELTTNWEKIKKNNWLKTPLKPTENDEETLGNYEVNGYWYSVSGNKITSSGTKIDATAAVTKNITGAESKVIMPTSYTSAYWLACRGVLVMPDHVAFGLGYVYDDHVFSRTSMFYSYDNESSKSYCLCPVVSLTSEIPE